MTKHLELLIRLCNLELDVMIDIATTNSSFDMELDVEGNLIGYELAKHNVGSELIQEVIDRILELSPKIHFAFFAGYRAGLNFNCPFSE